VSKLRIRKSSRGRRSGLGAKSHSQNGGPPRPALITLPCSFAWSVGPPFASPIAREAFEASSAGLISFPEPEIAEKSAGDFQGNEV
jgi:hypothetical protein